MFSCDFYEISKNIFFTEHVWWLLLCLYSFMEKSIIHRAYEKANLGIL